MTLTVLREKDRTSTAVLRRDGTNIKRSTTRDRKYCELQCYDRWGELPDAVPRKIGRSGGCGRLRLSGGVVVCAKPPANLALRPVVYCTRVPSITALCREHLRTMSRKKFALCRNGFLEVPSTNWARRPVIYCTGSVTVYALRGEQSKLVGGSKKRGPSRFDTAHSTNTYRLSWRSSIAPSHRNKAHGCKLYREVVAKRPCHADYHAHSTLTMHTTLPCTCSAGVWSSDAGSSTLEPIRSTKGAGAIQEGRSGCDTRKEGR